MFLDTRELGDGASLRAQVCVIGAGAAGITIARDLGEAGHDVLVLESGGLEPDPATQALYAATMTGELWGPKDAPIAVEDTRLRFFGGTTNHWAGYCRPLRPVDLMRREGVARSGWDISYAQLAAWYPRAAEVLGLVSDRFDPAWWADAAGHPRPLLDDDLVRTVVFQLSPVNFGVRYRAELEKSSQVRVLLHANAVAIHTDESGQHVESVSVRTLGGLTSTVAADVVVVATGGIETPRLLLASNERGGLGNGRDLVGRFFCEHFQATMGLAVLTTDRDGTRGYERQTYEIDGRQAIVQSAFVLDDAVVAAGGVLGMEAQLYPLPFPADLPRQASGVSTTELAPFTAALSDADVRSAVLLQVNAEQSLNPDSRISLTGEIDPIGMPRAALHWAHADIDRRSILAGLKVLGRALGRRALGRVQITPGNLNVDGKGTGLFGRYLITPDDVDPDHFHLAGGNHHMCTTRMAADPSQGVVDTDCRIHGMVNLFVAGSAVFSTSGVASPTITLVALASRLADHLDRKVLR